MVTANKKKTKAAYPLSVMAPAPAACEPTAVYSAEPPTFESVWRMFQETDKRLQENARQQREEAKESKERMDKLGIECTVKTKEDYDGRQQQQQQDIVTFFKKHFK